MNDTWYTYLKQVKAIQTKEERYEPFQWYSKMRKNSPVSYDAERKTWDIFLYDDVRYVLQDRENFNLHRVDGEGKAADYQKMAYMRTLINETFTPSAMKNWKIRLDKIFNDLLDPLVGVKKFDLVKSIAAPFPILVIAEMLGISGTEQEKFKEWAEIIVSAPESGSAAEITAMMKRKEIVMQELFLFITQVISVKKEHPDDGVISVLLEAGVDDAGEPITSKDIITFCTLLLFAGIETTTHLISNAMYCLMDKRETFEEIKENKNLIPSTIEEVLRYRSPVQAMNRVVVQDVIVRDKLLKKGDYVVAWIGSANRDPYKFEHPDVFNHSRKPNQHLAFSIGDNFCLGAPLARLEARVALSGIIERYPNLEARDLKDIDPVQSPFVYGLKQFDLLSNI